MDGLEDTLHFGEKESPRLLDSAKGNEDSTNATLPNAAQVSLSIWYLGRVEAESRSTVPLSRCSCCMILFSSKDDVLCLQEIHERVDL